MSIFCYIVKNDYVFILNCDYKLKKLKQKLKKLIKCD